MNERIRELALKSGAFCEDEFERLISWGIEGTELTDEVQDFAELIINECIEIMMKEINNNTSLLSNPPKNGGIWDACNAVKKHFGVK